MWLYKDFVHTSFLPALLKLIDLKGSWGQKMLLRPNCLMFIFVPWLCNQMIKGFESCHLANHVTLLPAADAIVVVHQTQAQHINSQQSRLLMDYLKGHKRKLRFRENLFWNTSTRFLTLETPLLTLHTAGFGSSLIASISSENYTVSNSYLVGLLVHYILVIIVSISVRTEKGKRWCFILLYPFWWACLGPSEPSSLGLSESVGSSLVGARWKLTGYILFLWRDISAARDHSALNGVVITLV